MGTPNIWDSGFQFAGTPFDGGPEILRMPSYMSSPTIWLDTINGDDANAGTDPLRPVARLPMAIARASANSLIVVGAGSREVLANVPLSKAGLLVVGCGVGAARPRFEGVNDGGLAALTIAAPGCMLQNLVFAPELPNLPGLTAKVKVSSLACCIKACDFEFGANDASIAGIDLAGGGSAAFIGGCNFRVVEAGAVASGVLISAAVDDPWLEDCELDGGAHGWGPDRYAFNCVDAAPRLLIEDMRMRNQSHFGITNAFATYQIFGLQVDPGCRTFFAC